MEIASPLRLRKAYCGPSWQVSASTARTLAPNRVKVARSIPYSALIRCHNKVVAVQGSKPSEVVAYSGRGAGDDGQRAFFSAIPDAISARC